MLEVDFACVGAGPAGLGAASEAARRGLRVVVVDENARPGGQLFKQIHKFFGSAEHGAGLRGLDLGRRLLDEAEVAGVEVQLSTAAWGLYDGQTLALSSEGGVRRLKAKRLLFATGASERALPFPGWTLPGVVRAGAAQTMMNLHYVLPGRRVLTIGAGNVGLIVSYQLLQAGAQVVAVVEMAPTIGGYGVHAAKLRRWGVPILTSHRVTEVSGRERVEQAAVVELGDDRGPVPRTERVFDVDLVCVAVGLTPLTELCRLAGCVMAHSPALGGWVPAHDEDMRTSREDIFVAGDAAGIGEASVALDEGRLAGLAAARDLGHLSDSEWAEARGPVVERLAALRGGEQGARIAEAKASLAARVRVGGCGP